MTVAWNAVHAPTGRRARVTMLCPPPLSTPDVVDEMASAFREGIRKSRLWEGPDTLPVDLVEEVNGIPYAVTFLPDGVMLDEWLDVHAEEPIPLPLAMMIGSAVGHAVARAHESGVTHGGLHAANILLDTEHRPHLLDFALHTAAMGPARAAGFPGSASSPLASPGREFGEDDEVADLHGLGVILLQLLSGTRLETLKLAELAARLPRELPASLRESIGRALSQGRDPEDSPRALAAHLAFDVAWLQAMEPVTGTVGPARAEFGRSGVPAFSCSGDDEPPAPAKQRPAVQALQTPSSTLNAKRSTPEHLNTRRPEHRNRRWPRAVAAVVVLLVALGIGLGARRGPAPADEGPVRSASAGWIGIQVGPLPDHDSAVTLQRRLQRLWPSALVRLDAGRYWIQVATSAWPYRARAMARRLRAQGFPVRTVFAPPALARSAGGG